MIPKKPLNFGGHFLISSLIVVLVFLLGGNEAARGSILPGFGGPSSMNSVQRVTTWKQLEFGFPTEQMMAQALANGDLVVENTIPIDVQPSYGSRNRFRLFTTIPRFSDGIPYSLAMVTEQRRANGPVLQPYPNMDWHNRGKGSVDCDKITSAFRVVVNECNEMWVLDSGAVGSNQLCSPQLLVFDLNTDQLVQRYRFSSNLFTPSASLFINPISVVQDPPPKGRCQQMKIYVCDVTFFGIVIYDRATNSAWRAQNKFMFPNPDHGTHTINGESFNLMDGIFGMVSDKTNLYFHPLASVNEFAVPLSVLNNRTAWDADPSAYGDQFKKLGKRSSPCAAEAIDSKGFVYCVTFNPIQLIAWHVNTQYNPKNFVVIPANPNDLEFVSGMKVVRSPSGSEELWLISIRFQKIVSGTLDKNAENFQILKRPLEDIQNSFGNFNIQIDLHNKLIFN